MSNKFSEYEIVSVKDSRGETFSATVRNTNDPLPEDNRIYTLHTSDGVIQVAEENMKSTGEFETPFRFYEVVEIHPTDFETEPNVAKLVGQRGVVTAISVNDNTKEWGFAVEVQNGECWYFDAKELKSIHIFLSHERLYGKGEGELIARVSFNPKTEEETILSGNPELINNGPTPLAVDLDSLTP